MFRTKMTQREHYVELSFTSA